MTTGSLVSALREAMEFNLEQLRALEKECGASDNELGDLRRKAMALYYSRNDHQAVVALNLLCKLSGDADAFATLAQALARTGDYSRAEAVAQKAIEMDNSIPAAHQVRVAALLARGDAAGAKKAAAVLLECGTQDPRNLALAEMAGAAQSSNWGKDFREGLAGFPGLNDETRRMMEVGAILSLDPTY